MNTLIILSILLRLNVKSKMNYDFEEDGAVVIKELIPYEYVDIIKNMINSNQQIKAKEIMMNSPYVKAKILNYLDNSYIFHDYIFVIKKAQFHTCHRDYNGSFFNINQKYPSYTLLIFLEDMERSIEIIPKSHKSKELFSINLTDYTESIICRKGDAILFDANLIHSGSINNKQDNLRIQMKLSHKLKILSKL
jgi:ectoine hydroxylase-related dioxygenase (phytanoyl-CoA dioxygenase family)